MLYYNVFQYAKVCAIYWFQDLANAGATKRPTCCVLVLTKPTKGALGEEDQEKLKSDFDQVASEIKELGITLF